jgi:hypothetical protein
MIDLQKSCKFIAYEWTEGGRAEIVCTHSLCQTCYLWVQKYTISLSFIIEL